MQNYLDYILSVFYTVYQKPPSCTVGYGEDESADVLIANHTSHFFSKEISQPTSVSWKEWKGQKIPFFYVSEEGRPIITEKDDKVIINVDVIGSAFFFLSGWQEFYSTNRDALGRYPYKESFQSKHDILTVPVVNYYFDILKTAMEKAIQSNLERKLWPNAELAVTLSHDIDKINNGWKEDGFSALKKGHVIPFIKMVIGKLYGRDPWENLDAIIELEKSLDVYSTWFFITEQGNGNADYPLKQVKPYFKKIQESGSEVALHGSLGSSSNTEKLRSEMKALNEDIAGNRFHFLKLDPATFGNTIESAGLDYDASLGFAEHIGFRNGFCFPFHPYNIREKRAYNFLEIPLMVMDTTLHDAPYMGNDPQKMKKLDLLIEEVRKFNGLLSILWHNNYFSEHKYEGWGKVYSGLINQLKEKGSTFLTSTQIAEHLDEP